MLNIRKSDFISNHTISFINTAGVAPNPAPDAEMFDAVMVNAITPMYVLMMENVLQENINYGLNVTRLRGILGACIKDRMEEENTFYPEMLVDGIKTHPAAYMSIPRFIIDKKDGLVYLTPLICATIKICFTMNGDSGSMFWVMDDNRSLMFDKTLDPSETGIIGLVDDARVLSLEPIEKRDLLGNDFTYSCKENEAAMDILRLANKDAVWLGTTNKKLVKGPGEELSQYIVLYNKDRSTEDISSSGDMYRRITKEEKQTLRKDMGSHIHVESITKVLARQMIKVLEFDKARLSEIPDFIDFDILIEHYKQFI